MENPSPKLHFCLKLSPQAEEERRAGELDEAMDDPYDQLQVFQMIRHLNDPEYPLTLQQLNVVNLERCFVGDREVRVTYTPTIPHCSMAQIIGLMIKAKLIRHLPVAYKVGVCVTEGTHVKELDINKQINDKERVAAALENPNIKKVLHKGFKNSDRMTQLLRQGKK